MKIVVGAGHGGKDPGGGSNKKFKEKDKTLMMSLRMRDRFNQLGFEVKMVRETDKYIAPVNRASMVKNSGAEICISNHINNTWSTNAKGAETIHSIYSDGKLANMILDQLVDAGATKRRVFCKSFPKNPKKDYYFMHRWTGSVETIIVEYGFASNKEDTEKIINDWEEYVEAVVKAVCIYTGVEYVPPKEEDHWAEEPFDKLVDEYKIDIDEKRFDDNITRGEAFALAAKILDKIVTRD